MLIHPCKSTLFYSKKINFKKLTIEYSMILNKKKEPHLGGSFTK